MKNNKKNYNKMKRYWILFLKYRSNLNSEKWQKFRCFDQLMTEVNVVDYILYQNEELKATYEVYQALLFAVKNKNIDVFNKVLSTSYNNILDYMKTSLKTLNEFKLLIHILVV